VVGAQSERQAATAEIPKSSTHDEALRTFTMACAWLCACIGGEVTVLMESNRSVRVSGAWIRARKLEGELDVGGRRILRSHRGIRRGSASFVATAEPAGFWTGAKFALPYKEEARTWYTRRGRVVSLLFDIIP